MTSHRDRMERLTGVPIRRRMIADLMVRSAGNGPPLILLHGGGGSWTHWIRAIGPLSRHFTIHAPDQPGMGESRRVPLDIPMNDYIDLLAACIEAICPAEAPFSVAGFSFGGLTAAAVAARLRERVRSLTMIGPGGFRQNEAFRLDLPAKDPGMSDADINDLHRRNMATLLIHDSALIDDTLVALQRHNIEHADFNGRKLGYGDHLTTYLPQVTCPTQLFLGEKDPLPNPSVAARAAHICDLSPQCQVHIVSGASHWANYEGADRINPLMIKFINEAWT